MQNHSLMPTRGKAHPDDSLIPLINIVFLLLIFFMVAGQIAPQQDPLVRPPESTSRKALEPAPLELSLTRSGELRLDGVAIEPEQLETELAELTAGESELQVSVRADLAATAEDLNRIFDQLRTSGVSTITLHSRLADAK